MHTFVGRNKTRIHYNLDMSGECIICDESGQSVKVSCKDIMDFAIEGIREQKISELDQMEAAGIDWDLFSETIKAFEKTNDWLKKVLKEDV